MPQAKEALKTYVVEGAKYGEFPLDMLRRDDALPYGEDQAALVDRLCAFGEGKSDLPKMVRVTVASSSKFAPNVARWESFGWRVVECSDPTVILSKPTDAVRKFGETTEAVQADYAEALASLTPRQAWAAKVHRAIAVEVTQRLDKITPAESRRMVIEGSLDAKIAETRDAVTQMILRGEAVRASREPEDHSAFMRDARRRVEEAYPGKRLSETFMLGDTVYAVVRGRHMTQFAVMVDGDEIKQVFP